jgi:hypothetical protein
VAVCTDAGICDIGCTGGQRVDGGCGCAAGTRLCQDGQCHACCTNTDCPNNIQCNATTHACTGCVANFADCDNNQANGCETSLSDKNNCGYCGNGCCSGILCCGFFGGSEKCMLEGPGYVCDCP